MLYQAASGRVHSSEVDHDLCVFIKNNARTDFAALKELPIHDYMEGDDCVKCSDAIRTEVKSHEYDYGDADDDGAQDDGDEYEIDPVKKAAAEEKYRIRDAEKAIDNWMAIGGEFWEEKTRNLMEEIRLVPEPDSDEPRASEAEEAEASEEPTKDEEKQGEAETLLSTVEEPEPAKKATRRSRTASK